MPQKTYKPKISYRIPKYVSDIKLKLSDLEKNQSYMLVGVVFILIIVVISNFSLDSSIKHMNLQFDDYEGIEVMPLYDENFYVSDYPEEFICTDNVYISGNMEGADYIYLSTWHGDKKGKRQNELGFCFIRWNKKEVNENG